MKLLDDTSRSISNHVAEFYYSSIGNIQENKPSKFKSQAIDQLERAANLSTVNEYYARQKNQPVKQPRSPPPTKVRQRSACPSKQSKNLDLKRSDDTENLIGKIHQTQVMSKRRNVDSVNKVNYQQGRVGFEKYAHSNRVSSGAPKNRSDKLHTSENNRNNIASAINTSKKKEAKMIGPGHGQRKLVESKKTDLSANVSQIAYEQQQMSESQQVSQQKQKWSSQSPQILQLLQQKANNGFTHRKSGVLTSSNAQQRVQSDSRFNNGVDTIVLNTHTRRRMPLKKEISINSAKRKSRVQTRNNSVPATEARQKGETQHLSLPGDTSAEPSAPPTAVANTVEEDVTQAGRPSPREVTDFKQIDVQDQKEEKQIPQRGASQRTQLHQTQNTPLLSSDFPTSGLANQHLQLLVEESTTGLAGTGEVRKRVGSDRGYAQNALHGTQYTRVPSSLATDQQQMQNAAQLNSRERDRQQPYTNSMRVRQANSVGTGNQGQSHFDVNKIDRLTDQLQNLEISSPNSNFETVKSNRRQGASAIQSSLPTNSVALDNHKTVSRQRRFAEQQMQAPSSAQAKDAERQQFQLGERLRSTNSIPGGAGNRPSQAQLIEANKAKPEQQPAYSSQLWLPNGTQRISSIDNERSRIQEVVNNPQPTRFHASSDSEHLSGANPISSVHHQNQPTGIPEQVLQSDSNQIHYQPTMGGATPTPATLSSYIGPPTTIITSATSQKNYSLKNNQTDNANGLGNSAAIIGVGSQIIQSGSTSSKISSNRKINNASILGRAAGSDLSNDRSHQLQHLHGNVGAERNLANPTMRTHEGFREDRFTSSREGNHDKNMHKPDEILATYSPNSDQRPSKLQDQHMAVMKDLMPHYSEVMLQQQNVHKDQNGSVDAKYSRHQRFDELSSMPQRVSVTPTKIPSYKNQEQLYQPSAANANSATHPSKTGTYNLISSPRGSQQVRQLNQARDNNNAPVLPQFAPHTQHSSQESAIVEQGLTGNRNSFGAEASRAQKGDQQDGQDINQLGQSRTGQYSRDATLNSVRTVQIPNAMNGEKSALLQGADNMTNAYQHFLSTASQHQQELGTPLSRKLHLRTKQEPVDIRSKKNSVPVPLYTPGTADDQSNKNNKFKMQPYNINYDTKTGVFNTSLQALEQAQETQKVPMTSDDNADSQKGFNNNKGRNNQNSTQGSLLRSGSDTSQRGIKQIKNNQMNSESPYKAYNTVNRQSSLERNPEQHQQDFVIRKLPKQNADSRKKLMLGGEQETKADMFKDTMKDRGQLKRKRDDDDLHQPILNTDKLVMDVSQQSNTAAMTANKRQRISYSKSKAQNKRKRSNEDMSASGSDTGSAHSVDAGIWSQKSVKSFVSSKSLVMSPDSSASDSQSDDQSSSDQGNVRKSTARQGKQQSKLKKNRTKEADGLSLRQLAKWNEEKRLLEGIPTDYDAFARLKVTQFIELNPINPIFIRREKARLPYSVFKPHSLEVTFLKSIFEGRPPTAFFPYPPYVHLERVSDRIRIYNREEIEYLFMSFKISDSTHIYNAVVNSCKNAGFTMVETPNPYFNVQWTGYITANDIKHLNKYQKTNHFPGSSQLGRKDLLWRNMNRLRIKYPNDFAIAPMSYLLSEDFEAFQAERERDPDCLWILKPVAASCGRGIRIVTDKTRISKKEGILACKYIANPHLINGLKYDLRVYVLVTSFNPLKVYIYNDGLVRFATEKYSNDPKMLSKKYVHLTNFSVNKKNINFIKNQDKAAKGLAGDDEDDHDGENSSKWDFKMLREAYERQGINYQYVHAQFKDLIVKTLLCVEPHITSNIQKNPTSRNNCFEVYGFDIMVDDKQKPWVLEVNVLPSLSSSSPFDKRIKTMLICDALTLIGIRGYDKSKFHAQSTELLGLPPFAQSMSYVELKQKENGQLQGNEELTKDEMEMLMDLDEEFMRRGNFQRVFPLASNVQFYEQFFEVKRYQNSLVAAYLSTPQEVRDKLLLKHKRIYFSEV